MRDTRPPAIALMGPTASGKTALAVDWAQRLGTEVISVDSALVYRGLEIGAAKPDAATRALAPHHLVDVRDPHEVFSAADFAREALPPMLALAALTKPGPFRSKTRELGPFVGIKRDGELVAMAGRRLRVDGFTELSGVCTHPDHRGKGYAAALSRIVVSEILATGEAAFLHAFADHEATIAFYRGLGFQTRARMIYTSLGEG